MICKCGQKIENNVSSLCDRCFENKLQNIEPIIIADSMGRMMINPKIKT